MEFSKSSWPTPEFDDNNEPHFLFMITPPRSGSTAMSELINSSHRTMILQGRGEGQWLIPGMCEEDRWNTEKKIDYSSVKAVWLRQFQGVQKLVKNVDVVIEKSPPNMMRIQDLLSTFKNHSLLATNREPCAYSASTLYRQYNAGSLGPVERRVILNRCIDEWIKRSKIIREIVVTLDSPLLTYEKFCGSTSSIINKLQLPTGVAETINTEAVVKVKDYKLQKIENQNERQISKLTNVEVESMKDTLEKHEDLLYFFGY